MIQNCCNFYVVPYRSQVRIRLGTPVIRNIDFTDIESAIPDPLHTVMRNSSARDIRTITNGMIKHIQLLSMLLRLELLPDLFG